MFCFIYKYLTLFLNVIIQFGLYIDANDLWVSSLQPSATYFLKNTINSLSLSQAPRRILKEEVTVRLSSCSDTIILQTPPVPPRISLDPPYERIFLLDPQYQDPTALRNNLPELSQSAEASGIHYLHKHTLALSQSLVGCLTTF